MECCMFALPRSPSNFDFLGILEVAWKMVTLSLEDTL